MNAKRITAPDISTGYPSKGTRLSPAWDEFWALLEASGTDWVDGRDAAITIAPKHGLNPNTLVAMISRAAAAGLLERQGFLVEVNESGRRRTRTHYRIAR
jgi:hypothetical protein